MSRNWPGRKSRRPFLLTRNAPVLDRIVGIAQDCVPDWRAVPYLIADLDQAAQAVPDLLASKWQ
jgi:hypothetical protein